MSLLDDVSIVVTPNGYKAGELYAVIPVPTEGAEEGANMDFSSGTSPWALNSNWSLGGVGVIADGTSNGTIWQNAVVEDNKQYIVTYTLTDFLQGTLKISLSGNDGVSRDIAGTYTEILTSGTSPTTRLTFEGGGNFKVTLSNVIVKEYTSADMDVTRATAATRVDEDGLVNYAEILGGEEVTNGDFATDLSGWTTSGTNATNTITWETNGARIISTGTNIGLFQNTLIVGKTYRLTCDVAITVGKIGLDGATSGSTVNMVEGFNEIIFTAISTTFKIKRITGNDNCLLDNVSVKEVTRDNVPRIDYTGGGCPHILAEPQRTNLAPISNDLNSWSHKVNVTITPDYSLSPDGSINSNRLLFSANGFTYNFKQQVISTVYSLSVYAKRNSGTENVGFFVNGSGSIQYAFNLTSEWQRFEYTYTSTNVSTFGIAGLSGADVSIFGFQSEEGSYATSYIPTSGSTVTRNQDIFTRDGIGSLINDSEGTLYFEGSTLENGGSSHRIISLSDGTSNNLIYIRIDNTVGRFRGFARGSSGSYTIITVNNIPQTDNNKIAIVWDATNFRIWINGSERATTTINNLPVGMNVLNLANTNGTADPFFGKVKQLQVYDTALTDTQLAALTS